MLDATVHKAHFGTVQLMHCSAPVVYSEAAVLDGAVHGELAPAFPDAPLHHLTAARHVPHLAHTYIRVHILRFQLCYHASC